ARLWTVGTETSEFGFEYGFPVNHRASVAIEQIHRSWYSAVPEKVLHEEAPTTGVQTFEHLSHSVVKANAHQRSYGVCDVAGRCLSQLECDTSLTDMANLAHANARLGSSNRCGGAQ